jgi:hypothetical protein
VTIVWRFMRVENAETVRDLSSRAAARIFSSMFGPETRRPSDMVDAAGAGPRTTGERTW